MIFSKRLAVLTEHYGIHHHPAVQHVVIHNILVQPNSIQSIKYKESNENN